MKFYIFTPEQESIWKDWVSTRPNIIQDLCRRFPPNELFKLKTTNQIVSIHSYSEDRTLTVNILPEFNELLIIGRQVFGINPDDLEEID